MKLKLLDNRSPWKQRNKLVSLFVRQVFATRGESGPIKVLEAGCGRRWPLDLGDLPLEITGVDIDGHALDERLRAGDLHRGINEDLRTVNFHSGEFDFTYCCDVLEHIQGAEPVLNRFFDWVRPGGIVVLIIPDKRTVFGWGTRCSPHWLHVAYHKYVLRMKNAGRPGHSPYRTYYDDVISRPGIWSFCAKQGHKIVLEYGYPPSASDWPEWFLRCYQVSAPLISTLSRGKIASSHIGLIYAIEKNRARADGAVENYYS